MIGIEVGHEITTIVLIEIILGIHYVELDFCVLNMKSSVATVENTLRKRSKLVVTS